MVVPMGAPLNSFKGGVTNVLIITGLVVVYITLTTCELELFLVHGYQIV